jgi:hypothetical protein
MNTSMTSTTHSDGLLSAADNIATIAIRHFEDELPIINRSCVLSPEITTQLCELVGGFLMYARGDVKRTPTQIRYNDYRHNAYFLIKGAESVLDELEQCLPKFP